MLNRDIRVLKRVIGEAKVSHLTDVFMEVIDFLSALVVAETAYSELEKLSFEKMGLTVNSDGFIIFTSNEQKAAFLKTKEDIDSKEVKIDCPKLTNEQFSAFVSANTDIIANELLLIKKHLVT